MNTISNAITMAYSSRAGPVQGIGGFPKVRGRVLRVPMVRTLGIYIPLIYGNYLLGFLSGKVVQELLFY